MVLNTKGVERGFQLLVRITDASALVVSELVIVQSVNTQQLIMSHETTHNVRLFYSLPGRM